MGGWVRDHGSVQTGGGIGKRPWVYTDRWGGGGWTRDHGSIQTGGGDGQDTMGLYKQVGGWTRDHGSVQTSGGGGEMGKRPWVYTDK